VWIWWSGKSKIVRQVFLNKVTVTSGEGAVIFFCDLDSTAHVGSLLVLIVCACHDNTSDMCGSSTTSQFVAWRLIDSGMFGLAV
jgi:hypothetical protein